MRISDWSSDVCSSYLQLPRNPHAHQNADAAHRENDAGVDHWPAEERLQHRRQQRHRREHHDPDHHHEAHRGDEVAVGEHIEVKTAERRVGKVGVITYSSRWWRVYYRKK